MFNNMFDTAIIPDTWLNGVILPIYKNKRDPSLPENYRPIPILSCLGKLFTSVINNRLTKFVESNNFLSENQAGFRKGYSVTDHLFIFHSVIDYLRYRKKKKSCTFIDFSKAFDQVWRSGLLFKVINLGISGKCFNVIFNMYQNIKSCVKFDGNISE